MQNLQLIDESVHVVEPILIKYAECVNKFPTRFLYCLYMNEPQFEANVCMMV